MVLKGSSHGGAEGRHSTSPWSEEALRVNQSLQSCKSFQRGASPKEESADLPENTVFLSSAGTLTKAHCQN